MPIFSKVFKSKDIKNSNRLSEVARAGFGFKDSLIYFIDHPYEHAPIDALDKGVPDVHRGLRVHGGDHALAAGKDGACDQGLHHLVDLDIQEPTHLVHIFGTSNLTTIDVVHRVSCGDIL